ncbi:MAG: ATP-binding cassette domain-containing protein [Actinobacteria bacterium]|nr:MAG: ATP-binding cassette domain-containing protein [Actinomycetota bacterium]
MDEPLVRAVSVARRYGASVDAMRQATFEVHRRDAVALVGPSGSGKSTLLHLIAGLDRPTSGEIAWPALGPVEVLRPQHVGVAFQGPSLLPPLNVVENVALPLLLAGMPEPDATTLASEMIGRFDLDMVGDKLPEELSGGQAQRANVARALVARPALVLADEPTGQQDRASVQRVLDVVIAIVEQTGAALLVATHDPAVAERLRVRWSVSAGELDTGASLWSR